MKRTEQSAARWWAVAGVLALVLAGCDTTSPSLHVPEVVVESYQIANAPLQPIRLSESAPVGATYNFSALALRQVAVQVHLLDDVGTVEQTYAYREDFENPGVYLSVTPARVLPLRTYRLAATFPDRPTVTAETIVPGAFQIESTNLDTVVYQSTDQLEIDVTPSTYPGRQAVYIFSIEALEPSIDALTPFYREIIDPDPDDDVDELGEFIVVESPILNEANNEFLSGGLLRIRVPWLAVAFYGPTRATASALDDNLYDFIRSQSVQQGGSTFSPGEIPNVLENVENGRGVFGSLARVSARVYIARPPAR